jgi:hypothetical protein
MSRVVPIARLSGRGHRRNALVGHKRTRGNMQAEPMYAADDDAIVFAAPVRQRAKATALYVLSGIVLVLLWLSVGALMFGLMFGVYQAPATIAAAMTLPVLLTGLYLTWKLLMAKPRFRIAVRRSVVAVGAAYWEDELPLDDVEVISPLDDPTQHGVTLKGGGRKFAVHLAAADEARCVAVLRERCENALLIDRAGHTYLPRSASRPLATANAYCRTLRSRARLGIGAVVAVSIGGLAMGAALFDGIGQKGGWGDWVRAALLGGAIAACLVIVVWGVRYARANYRAIRMVERRLSAAQWGETDRDVT